MEHARREWEEFMSVLGGEACVSKEKKHETNNWAPHGGGVVVQNKCAEISVMRSNAGSVIDANRAADGHEEEEKVEVNHAF